jgi:hypothetical protein
MFHKRVSRELAMVSIEVRSANRNNVITYEEWVALGISFDEQTLSSGKG